MGMLLGEEVDAGLRQRAATEYDRRIKSLNARIRREDRLEAMFRSTPPTVACLLRSTVFVDDAVVLPKDWDLILAKNGPGKPASSRKRRSSSRRIRGNRPTGACLWWPLCEACGRWSQVCLEDRPGPL